MQLFFGRAAIIWAMMAVCRKSARLSQQNEEENSIFFGISRKSP